MTSAARRSEQALAELACAALRPRARPRVLVGGLGMGFTLRAALDVLPPRAVVRVAELNPAVIAWCRGALAPLTDSALADDRVDVETADVGDVVARAARDRTAAFDAILLDLYEGPGDESDPHFGRDALTLLCGALRADGVLGVWSERAEPRFERRLARAGFRFERHRCGRGGLRHAVYVAKRKRPEGARSEP
jgi:spermidine synthase